MSLPKFVKLVEVSPRDGLQNEAAVIPVTAKVEFIHLLSTSGLSVIEAGSFVAKKRIPQLADSGEVFRSMMKHSGVRYVALVPNLIGFAAAMAAGAKEIAVFTTASEQFAQENINCSVAESLTRITQVVKAAQAHHIPVRAYLSCVMGCPYEGEVAVDKTTQLADMLYQLGCYEISLGDTIGIGTITKTKNLLDTVLRYVPASALAVHFHDTYGQALVNIYTAMTYGIAAVDCSVAGLGGCPYAKGATGNVATEDVLYLLNGMGIETGVDLQQLITAGHFICQQLGRMPNSKVSQTFLTKNRI